MLYGANKPFNVALVVLDENAVRKWAAAHGKRIEGEITIDPNVIELIEGELSRCGTSFRGFEKPAAFVLSVEDFTIDSGLLTPTLKLKRSAVIDRYKDRLEALYKEPPTGAARALASAST